MAAAQSVEGVKSSGGEGSSKCRRSIEACLGSFGKEIEETDRRQGTDRDLHARLSGVLVEHTRSGERWQDTVRVGEGKKATVLAVEFGEKLLYKVRQENGKMAKNRERWGYGIFVGVRPRSGEVWVTTGEKSLLQDPFE